MGLLQAAYRTYESQKHLAGVVNEGEEVLTPIYHAIINAHIEIDIGENGTFINAKRVPKAENKTIIPVTEESAGRTGDNDRAHPLSDQLRYLAPYGKSKHEAYYSGLMRWAKSEHSHPKVTAVLAYISGGTLLSDLSAAGVIELDENGVPAVGRIEGTEYTKCLVRWRVICFSDDSKRACWEDLSLISSFIDYTNNLLSEKERDLCIISGNMDVATVSHPKGVLPFNYGAKLISANDDSGFTYRGRFTEARQTGTVGLTASQKAHGALRWLATNHGMIMGGRTFLWWNPDGKALPPLDYLGMENDGEHHTSIVSYKRELLETLGGYRMSLSDKDDVVVAALDAATTGRLSVTYYNELRAMDFLDRLQNWYETCCIESRFYHINSPPIKLIAKCACGTQRGSFIEADDRILRDYVQRLLQSLIDGRPIPADIVRSLAVKACSPLSYNHKNREIQLNTTCAVLRKYINDREKKEVWTLALDINNKDRSYLYGRLLAVAEQVERSAYSREEDREPNAIRMQAVFSRRPQYAWRILHEALEPYFKRHSPGLRKYFRDIIQDIMDSFALDTRDFNNRLDDTYLLGYYHQRAVLTTKKDKNNVTEENENESAE